MCIYGLYHGLIFLPVLLSLIGPANHNSVTAHQSDIHTPPPSRVSSHPLEQKNGKFVEKSLHDEAAVLQPSEKGVFTVPLDGEGGTHDYEPRKS